MYQVHEHREGIKAQIGVNGVLWEHGSHGHEWSVIHQGRKKAEAIAVADGCAIHAVVTKAYAASIEHDNGKQPGNRITDHRLDRSVPIRAPRDLAAYGLSVDDAVLEGEQIPSLTPGAP